MTEYISCWQSESAAKKMKKDMGLIFFNYKKSFNENAL